MTKIPIACTLTEPEQRERRSGIIEQFSAGVLERRETSEGYAFRFAPDSASLALLAEVIDLERQCCAFFCFRLTVEPDQGPIWLEITGPDGTKSFLSDWSNTNS